MFLWSLTYQQGVRKLYHSDKHFSEFLPTRWPQKFTGIDLEENYVTVALRAVTASRQMGVNNLPRVVRQSRRNQEPSSAYEGPGICRKSPILTHHTCTWRRGWGWPRSNFAEISGTKKLESLGHIVRCRLRDSYVRRFPVHTILRAKTSSVCRVVSMQYRLALHWRTDRWQQLKQHMKQVVAN